MPTAIQADVFVQQELASRGVTEKTGVYGEHKVQIGKSSPIRLDTIKSAKIPFAGFRTATKIARGKEGISNCAKDTLKTLSSRTGTLDAKSLLGTLKATQTHLERLDRLGQLTQAQKQDNLWIFTNTVQNLSNTELAAVYQSFTTAEMDLLQSALIREGQTNANATDARKAASLLFDLQALVLKEVSNRSVTEQINQTAGDLVFEGLSEQPEEPVARPKTLVEQYGGTPNNARHKEANDITAANLTTLVEVAAGSATKREKTALQEQSKLDARNIQGISTKEMADVLRSAELTINIDLNILLGDNSVIAHPDEPMSNIFHLAEQDIKPKGDAYLEKRDNIEQLLFPELRGHAINPNERPVYGALNTRQSKIGAVSPTSGYGSAAIVLKPEVAKRATYTVDDTFYAPKFSISPERRQNFYNLLDGSNLPQTLKEALADVNSEVRKSMDSWLDNLAQMEDKSVIQFKEGNYPNSVTKHLHDKASLDKTEQNNEYFQALLLKCFGDASSTRNVMASHDNLEALIPVLDGVTGNDLARAAINKQNGAESKMVLSGLNYIEAQIQGPLIPSRDIAEIRIDLNEIPADEQAGLKAKMQNFERSTGIHVNLVNDSEDDTIEKVVIDQAKFNMQHLDIATLEQTKNDILEHLEQHIQEIVADSPGLAKDLPAGVLKLEGNALNKLASKFSNALSAKLKQEETYHDAKSLVEETFRTVALPLLRQKASLLAELEKVHFNTPAQKEAFVNWVCSAGALKSPEEVRIIYTHAQAHAKVLKDIVNANPAPSAQEIFTSMSDLTAESAKDLDAFIQGLGEDVEFGADDKITEQNRISFMSLALLQNDEPPLDAAGIKQLNDRFNSLAMRTQFAQLGGIMGDRQLHKAADYPLFSATYNQIYCQAQNIAKLAGQQCKGAKFIGELSLLPESLRSMLKTTNPEMAKQLDELHPGYPPFPSATHPEQLPQNEADRRKFLVHVMDGYLNHEKTFEEGTSVHGRGHIARAYIFANVMCNIMEENGLHVDKNAVLCGIAGHDLGRQGRGQDYWEGRSATMTINNMQSSFGQDSMGQEYEQQIGDSIDAHKGKTLEAMLLNSADSLDIGRTTNFELDKFIFLKGKAGETTGSNAQKIREQLAVEADLLQRLTNPLCANRQVLDKIDNEVINTDNPEFSEMLSKQKEVLLKGIADYFKKDWDVPSDAYMQRFENTVRDNPQMFPLLSQYYH